MRHAVKNGFHKASFGEDAGQSKLTDTLVLELRNKYMSGLFTVRQLAKDMDMNHSAIWCAITGRTWKHVKTIELLKQEQL